MDRRFARLSQAVRKIYYAAHWLPDRAVDAATLWQNLRDAAGLPPGGTSKLGPPRVGLAANERLRTALKAAKIGHYVCEDGWYSCPKSAEGCLNDHAGADCTCDADRHNAAIDAALAAE